MIKAVFFDIDGTLLDHQHGSVMHDSTRQSLAAMQKKGIKVFVATGRFPGMLGQVRTLFPFDGFVTLNGQLVTDRDGKVLHRLAHRPEAIRAMLELQERDPFPCLIIEEEESFPFRESPEIAMHYGWLGQQVPPPYDPDRLETHPVLQFLAYMPWEERDRLSPIPYIEPTYAGGSILDVMPQGGGKEKGIAAAAACYGITRDEVMTFGDGINDARMLAWAGIGVAMGNGVQKAKEAADYVTTPIDQDGVKNALLRFSVLTPEDFAE